MAKATAKEFLESANRIVELNQQLEDEKAKLSQLAMELPQDVKAVLGMVRTSTATSTSTKRTRTDPEDVKAAITTALKANKKLTKGELVSQTGFDTARITNALAKMDNIRKVAADAKKPLNKINMAYSLA